MRARGRSTNSPGWLPRVRHLIQTVRGAVLAPVVVVGLFGLGACDTPPEPFRIELSTGGDAPRVVVHGLSSQEASGLRTAGLTDPQWQALLRVTTTEGAGGMAGRYAVVGTTIEFGPAFPLDPGRPYQVAFDPSRLPQPRAAALVAATVALPGSARAPRVSVSAIYPSSDVWPLNLLRFYVHFSGPMARETGAGRVHILDDSGVEVVDALLPSPVDFWSPDQTRYTVLFEPGRVKRGIQPNRDMGRALVEGRSYTVVVDSAWRDVSGQPLTGEYRKTFRAGPAREAALALGDWRFSTPAVGSREPLVVTVPALLDRALFARTVGVMRAGQPLAGVVDVAAHETEWRFTPAESWQAGPYALAVLSALEDPSGNRIGRAFEVLPTDPSANADPPERFTIALTLR